MTDPDDILIVYLTASSREEADRIADAVIKEKLAACANILGVISSVYEWEGKIEHADETAMIVKTVRTKFSALEARIKELHSYECPCIVAWEVSEGHAPFLDWVRSRQV